MKKSNFRICVVDPEEQNVYLCRHLEKEGNEVLLLSSLISPEGTNLYDSAHSPDEVLEWNPDFCLFTRPGLGRFAYHLYAQGIKTVAGGLIQDQFCDSGYLRSLAARAGIQIGSNNGAGDRAVLVAGLFSRVGFCGPALRIEQLPNFFRSEDGVPLLCLKAQSEESPFAKAFHLLQKVTAAVDYCGWLFARVDPETGWILSVDPHTPDGFWSAFLAGLEQPLGWLLSSLSFLERKKRFRFQFTEDTVGTVKVSMPPYPFEPGSVVPSSVPLNQAVADSSHLLEVQAINGEYTATGSQVAWFAGHGDPWEQTVKYLAMQYYHIFEHPQPEIADPFPQEVVSEVAAHG